MFSEFQKTSHGPQFFFLGALIFFFFSQYICHFESTWTHQSQKDNFPIWEIGSFD